MVWYGRSCKCKVLMFVTYTYTKHCTLSHIHEPYLYTNRKMTPVVDLCTHGVVESYAHCTLHRVHYRVESGERLLALAGN